MNKYFIVLAWVVLVSITGLMVFNFYQQLKPVRLLEIKSPMIVLSPEVKTGQDVVYHASYCRYSQVPAKVFRSLIGPSIINLPPVESSTEIGCRETDVHITVPGYAIPGKYKMKAVAEFQISAQRLDRIYYETEEFTVK